MALPQPGDVLLDKYELEWELGRGGYGVVYKGQTLSTGRPVAIKVLKPSRSAESPRVVERFKREMSTVAKLQCPHTMTLYDFGRTDDGVLFMVCEYVEGVDLLDLIVRRGTVKQEYVLDILRQMLLSLSEAHELGILHRDIKPANIRVEFPENSRLRAKLLDFGLTMDLDGADSRLTKTGFVVGTPRYMSPEQIRGTGMGPPSDLFSLGVVMIESLLGKGSVQVAQVPHLDDDAPIDPRLRAVLNRLTALDLNDRYQTASDVLSDLPRRVDEPNPTEADTLPAAILPPAGVKDRTTTEFVAPQTPAEPVEPQQVNRSATAKTKLLIALLSAVTCALAVLVYKVATDRPEPESTRIKLPPSHTPQETAAQLAKTPPPDQPGLAEEQTTCGGAAVFSPGVHQIETRDVFGTPDLVWVYLPPGYDGSRRHRVILMFTDIERTGEDAIRMIARQKAHPDLEDFVVISGVPKGELWWTRGPQYRRGLSRLQGLSEVLCIDAEPVFLLGHGAGGAAVLHGMCDPFVAAAAVTSFRIRTDGEMCGKPHAPLLLIETDDNPYAPIDGDTPCTSPLPIRSLQSHEAAFVHKFRCASGEKEVRRRRETCTARTCTPHLETCLVEGGRDWPGTPPIKGACGSKPGRYDFRRRIWRFFEDAPTAAP